MKKFSGQWSVAHGQSPVLWLSGYCALPLAWILLALLFLPGCSSVQRDPPVQVWDDMKHQEKFKPQMQNDLFADHRDSRRPPEGTVARGHMVTTIRFTTPAWKARCTSARIRCRSPWIC